MKRDSGGQGEPARGHQSEQTDFEALLSFPFGAGFQRFPNVLPTQFKAWIKTKETTTIICHPRPIIHPITLFPQVFATRKRTSKKEGRGTGAGENPALVSRSIRLISEKIQFLLVHCLPRKGHPNRPGRVTSTPAAARHLPKYNQVFVGLSISLILRAARRAGPPRTAQSKKMKTKGEQELRALVSVSRSKFYQKMA